jgi:hypothetical protein
MNSLAYAACAQELAKEAGLREKVEAGKRLLLKDVPGTKPWVIGRTDPARTARVTGKAVKKRLRSAPQRGGTFDLSREAAAMGIV